MENIIVIGGGLMGSSVAWQLSQYGEKVLLLEQQDTKYQTGSSFGKARITRNLGTKNDIFSYVQESTVKEVHKLLDYLNGIDQSKKHKISEIYSKSPVNYIYNKNYPQELNKLKFKGKKKYYKKASGDAAFRKFGITLPSKQLLIRESKKYSGTFNPKKLIAKMQLGIKKYENQIRYNSRVIRISKKNNYYELKVKNTRTNEIAILQTKKIVVAAGPYSVPLIKKMAPYFKRLITPKKILLSYFQIKKKVFNNLTSRDKKVLKKAHPIFDQNGKMYFSMVEKYDKNGNPIFKVGGHYLRGNIPNLNSVWSERPRKKIKKWNKKHFKKYIQMLEIPIRKSEIKLVEQNTCVYSVSKKEIPYVTNLVSKNHLINNDIVFVGGMSGIGAKGCLAYGMIAADLITGTNNVSKMYQKTKRKLGNERLLKEISKPFFKI
ncbi:MAG: FAD-dependent oxidoreductase [Saprospiraceae bacterium]